MKVGDLVKRKESEWEKHNVWLTFKEKNETGIVLREEGGLLGHITTKIVVMWSSGFDWCDPEDLEVVYESR